MRQGADARNKFVFLWDGRHKGIDVMPRIVFEAVSYLSQGLITADRH